MDDEWQRRVREAESALRRAAVQEDMADAYDAFCQLEDMPFYSGRAAAHHLTYGELQMEEIVKVLDACADRKHRHFVDLGSGNGKLVMIAGMFLEHATGIECVPERHAAASELLEKFDSRVLPLCPRPVSISLVCGDIMAQSWDNFDLVFSCCTCFGTELRRKVVEKALLELPNGATVVSVTHLLAGKASEETQAWPAKRHLVHEKTLHLSCTFNPLVPVYIQRITTFGLMTLD